MRLIFKFKFLGNVDFVGAKIRKRTKPFSYSMYLGKVNRGLVVIYIKKYFYI